MTTNSLSTITLVQTDDFNLYDLGRLDITATSLRDLINSIPDDYMTSSEDASVIFRNIGQLYRYLSADMLDDVYNADYPDSSPEAADALDHETSELHIALTTLDKMIDLSVLTF